MTTKIVTKTKERQQGFQLAVHPSKYFPVDNMSKNRPYSRSSAQYYYACGGSIFHRSMVRIKLYSCPM